MVMIEKILLYFKYTAIQGAPEVFELFLKVGVVWSRVEPRPQHFPYLLKVFGKNNPENLEAVALL